MRAVLQARGVDPCPAPCIPIQPPITPCPSAHLPTQATSRPHRTALYCTAPVPQGPGAVRAGPAGRRGAAPPRDAGLVGRRPALCRRVLGRGGQEPGVRVRGAPGGACVHTSACAQACVPACVRACMRANVLAGAAAGREAGASAQQGRKPMGLCCGSVGPLQRVPLRRRRHSPCWKASLHDGPCACLRALGDATGPSTFAASHHLALRTGRRAGRREELPSGSR